MGTAVYADEEDVSYVESLIENITDQETLDAAREAYDALSMADKLDVSNLQTLLDAEENGFEEVEDSSEEYETDTAPEETQTESEEDQIGFSQDNPANGEAENIYWYSFDPTSQSLLSITSENKLENITIISPDGNEISLSSNDTSYSDDNISVLLSWNEYNLSLTVSRASEGTWILYSDTLISVTSAQVISAIEEETEEETKEETKTPIGAITVFLLIIVFIVFYFFFFKKKTTLKRKELPKRSAEEEIDKIKQELSAYDFNDYGKQPDLSFLRERQQDHFDISEEQSYEELDDGTKNLHGLSYEEESRKYLKKEKENYDRQ